MKTPKFLIWRAGKSGKGAHGPMDLIGFLKETYQILKETYPILKETYQILDGALIGPYGALAPSAASPGEVILAKIVVSVKYPVILRIETGKMISAARRTHPEPSQSPI